MKSVPYALLLVCSAVGISGCGIDKLVEEARANNESGSSTGERKVTVSANVDGKPAGSVTIVTQDPNRVASSTVPGSKGSVPGSKASVPEMAPSDHDLEPLVPGERGSCLVQGEFFVQHSWYGTLKPFVKADSTREECVHQCNEALSKTKFFANGGGCRYSCEFDSGKLVEPFANSKACTITVAKLK